jgi:outer membrane lipoprotein SlyB
MKTKLFELWLAAAAVGLLAAGCETPEGTPNRTATGALIGGGIGAASGALIGGGRHGAEGALIGGALGAVTGGLIGHSMDEEQRERLRAQAPQTYERVDQGQPLGLADVKAMAKAGVGDEVIISQIRSTHTIYRLSAADIIDLHNSGVSQKVMNFMINTASQGAAAPTQSTVTYVAQAPPPPPVETVVVAPAPGYIWIGGEWVWQGRWVWAAGHWGYPPRPGVVWVGGYWAHGPHGWHHSPGHWH